MEQEINLTTNKFFDSPLIRLKSTLNGRLNILNLFGSFINKKYKKLTVENINIDTNSEMEIINFLIKNNKEIEYLRFQVTDIISKHGSFWQKSRLT